MGSACVMLDRDADAVEPLRRATRLMPDNAVPPFLLGVALYETNQFAEAVRAFGEAAKREPEDRMIDIWRAKALYDNGQTDDAIRMVDSFMAVSYTHLDVYKRQNVQSLSSPVNDLGNVVVHGNGLS